MMMKYKDKTYDKKINFPPFDIEINVTNTIHIDLLIGKIVKVKI